MQGVLLVPVHINPIPQFRYNLRTSSTKYNFQTSVTNIQTQTWYSSSKHQIVDPTQRLLSYWKLCSGSQNVLDPFPATTKAWPSLFQVAFPALWLLTSHYPLYLKQFKVLFEDIFVCEIMYNVRVNSVCC